MSSPSLIKYPYDATGLSPFNRVVGEIISLPRGARERAYALQGGPFFGGSVVVTTVPNNVVLERGVHYEILYQYQEATKKVGQPINAVIYVFDTAITGDVSVDYQVIGGEFSSNVSAIQALIETLQIDERQIVWDDILDKPVTFPPAPHLHHVGDLYGMEAVIDALDRLTAVIGTNSSTDLSDIYTRLNALDTAVAQQSALLASTIQAMTLLQQQLIDRANALEEKQNIAITIESATDLLPGRQHLFMATANGRLPNVVGLPLKTQVFFSRRQIQIRPTVTVFDPDTTTVRYGTLVGTGINYITRNDLKATLVEPFVWEITNDND